MTHSIDIPKLEADMLKLPQAEHCVEHIFAPGVYVRQIFMPAGAFLIGHTHKTEHLNVVLKGKARVLVDGKVVEISAPFTFKSGAGAQKVLYILEDMIWQTIHATDETDVQKLEAMLVRKSPVYLSHQLEKELMG